MLATLNANNSETKHGYDSGKEQTCNHFYYLFIAYLQMIAIGLYHFIWLVFGDMSKSAISYQPKKNMSIRASKEMLINKKNGLVRKRIPILGFTLPSPFFWGLYPYLIHMDNWVTRKCKRSNKEKQNIEIKLVNILLVFDTLSFVFDYQANSFCTYSTGQWYLGEPSMFARFSLWTLRKFKKWCSSLLLLYEAYFLRCEKCFQSDLSPGHAVSSPLCCFGKGPRLRNKTLTTGHHGNLFVVRSRANIFPFLM